MNVILAAQDYVMRMLSMQSAAGMKVLLLDAETAGVVSLVCSQSAALQKEVYLFERIDSPKRETMLHLKCVAFLRPTPENIALLSADLRDPKYGEYHIFFSNVVRKAVLEELAQADEHEVVKQVQEFYADFYAINQDLFTLYSGPAVSTGDVLWQRTQERAVDGLSSIILALKKRPVIRYAKGSELAQRVASDVARRMQQEQELFDLKRTEPTPVMLVLDRRDDPVTPLLFQWTYQAMVHECLGLVKNRVDLASLRPPGAAPPKDDMREAVLSADQDTFFRDAMYMDFGDLGAAVKDLVEQYQSHSKTNEGIQSLEDIKAFLERYPDFRKMGASASKHVTIMGEISKRVEQRLMLEVVGKVEQDIACHNDHASAFRQLSELLHDSRLDKRDMLRLVLLYALRYENEGRLTEVADMMRGAGMTTEEVGYIAKIIRYAGSQVRGVDLFGNSSIWAKAKSSVRRGIRGVQNVFTEHRPFLMELLDNLYRGKLKDVQFPAIPETVPAGASSLSPALAANAAAKVAEVIVFVVGGVTFEEALHVAEFNRNPPVPGARVVLGGTDILNSAGFLQSLDAFAASSGPSSFSSSSSASAGKGASRKVW